MFRNHLRCHRTLLGLTLEAIAPRVGYSAKHLDRLELGYFVPKADRFLRLAHTLGVSAEALVDTDPLTPRTEPSPP